MIGLATVLLLLMGAAGKSERAPPDCGEGGAVKYTAAALEFSLPLHANASYGSMITQARRVRHWAKEAHKYSVDILVCPEEGLELEHRQKGEAKGVVVPNPSSRTVPCDDSTDGVLHEYSCAAKENELYLAANIAELVKARFGKDQTLYNTMVVFDRTGAIIARYRKKHLFFEPGFTAGQQQDELAMFETDFGVTFGTHICFDIFFQRPSLNNIRNRGVRDFVMSVSWVDILPFFQSINIFNGWSRAVKSNLIVAGEYDPATTQMGTGIFRGFSDMNHTYVYNNTGGHLVVGTVDTCKSTKATYTPKAMTEKPLASVDGLGKVIQLYEEPAQHYMMSDDLSKYAMKPLPLSVSREGWTNVSACKDSFCCQVDYQHNFNESADGSGYQLAVYEGFIVRQRGETFIKLYSQICSVVWCADQADIQTCGDNLWYTWAADQFGPFVLKSSFANNSLVIPTVITREKTLVDNDQIDVSTENRKTEMFVKTPVDNLLSAALLARVFDRDE